MLQVGVSPGKVKVAVSAKVVPSGATDAPPRRLSGTDLGDLPAVRVDEAQTEAAEVLGRVDDARVCGGERGVPRGRCEEGEAGRSRERERLHDEILPSGATFTPSSRRRSRIRNWNVDQAPRRASNMR